MKFTAQIDFRKKDGESTYLDGKVVSDIYLLSLYMTSVEYDIFNPNINESEVVKALPDGHYFAYITGTMQAEEAGDPDVGTGEMSFIFLADDKDIRISRLELDNFVHKIVQKSLEVPKEK